nr:Chain C, MELANOMA-ASSOCIATED ANTIGEN 1 [Homo sapiens]1W72_F Chain F, MELANOMA-ASSOCIATED ANTIGEN 1 [Homo sapiens]3BO8_C Chain C, nonameric peptide from Melanoma-associated antigen 1 [synthetic construct]
EADPTGHSY